MVNGGFVKKLLLLAFMAFFSVSYGYHRDRLEDDTLSTDTNLDETEKRCFERSQVCLSAAARFVYQGDFGTAQYLLKSALLYSSDHDVKKIAYNGLGQLYFYGGNGVVKNHKEAEKYFTFIKDDPYFSPQDDYETLLFLGKIYYLGEDGVQKDLNKAQFFLDSVKEHPDLSASDRLIIRTYLDDIARYVTSQRSRSFGALLSVADQALAIEQQKKRARRIAG